MTSRSAAGVEAAALRAPWENRRLDGGRQNVPARHKTVIRFLAPQLADERRQARHPAAAAAVHRFQHVVVIDLQERQPDQIRIADGRGSREAGAEDEGENEKQRGARRARAHDAAAVPVTVRVFQWRSGRRATRSARSRWARSMSRALKHASSNVSWKTSRWARLPPSSITRGVSGSSRSIARE